MKAIYDPKGKAKEYCDLLSTMNKKYLTGAIEEMRKIYISLGNSPTSAEYNKHAAITYNIKRLKKEGMTPNELKKAAGVPLNKSGMKKGTRMNTGHELIYCPAYGGEIMSADCIPGYKKEFCKDCKSKQKGNVKAIPDLPD